MAKLLTNLFDNAIEASKEANTKEIVYKIECNEYNFIVRIKNTYNQVKLFLRVRGGGFPRAPFRGVFVGETPQGRRYTFQIALCRKHD